MYALPAAPAPSPRRQLLAGTALGGAALAMFFGGMLAVWMRFRNAAPLKESSSGKLIADWIPQGVTVHDVAANLMLISLVAGCVMAQMAVYSGKRNDHVHVGLGLGIATLMALAVINAQAFEYSQMAVPVAGGVYQSMFYAITGAFLLLMIGLSVYTVLAAFRYLGGRSWNRELLASVALSWYVTTAIYCAVWFFIYVTK